jgi:hypothetical protein
MGMNVLLRTEQRNLIVIPLVLLPWLAVVLITAGSVAAFNFLAYAIVVFAAGYSLISAALPAFARAQAMFLAPAAGILAISALTAFWVRLGHPLIWATAFWVGLAVAGALGLWTDRALWTRSTVPYGYALALLSALICVLFFLPGASRDAVMRHDGSFNWMYADTQFFHAMAANIKQASPPTVPGTATAELYYHFGPYAPAAAISRLDSLSLGDAYARVTRGASLWALVLSCFGLGTLLSIKATGEKLGGIMSVAGLFFYGSILSLFNNELNSSSYVTGAILFNIPGIEVLAQGGPFSHLILGHSVLHGLVAMTAIMGLCLLQREHEAVVTARGLTLAALPALAVAINSVAALYCLGVVGILLFWDRLRVARSWPLIVLMFGMFLGAWKIMGYSHAGDVAVSTINHNPGSYWWAVAVWFTVGLGIRILGFQWISKPFKDPMSALVLVSVIGLMLFWLLMQLEGNERYGVYYLQALFSIFAFSRLTPGWWRSAERSKWTMAWLRMAKIGMIFLAACGLLVFAVAFLTHRHTGITSFPFKLLLCLFFILLLIGISAVMKRHSSFSIAASAILMGVLMVGFLAWITPWLNFGMGRMKMDVTLSPGEVTGLYRLRGLAAPDERFATNKHLVDTTATEPERSYSYDAISERPVLLEGYAYHDVQVLPWFKPLLHDNDMLFSTTDPETLHRIAEAWHVRWLVARPGTDIALPRPLPPWLVQQERTGSLRIYEIDNLAPQ